MKGVDAFAALRLICPEDANYLVFARQLAARPGLERMKGSGAIRAWAGDNEQRRKEVFPHVLSALKDDQCYL